MRPLWSLVPLLFAVACATPPAPKMTFAEMYGEEQEAATDGAAVPASIPRVAATPTGATSSLELQAALIAFSARARSERGQVNRGAPMPVAQVSNWEALISALDGFLDRAPRQTSSYDVIRARVTLEAELEMDGRAYGDIPPDLAERAMDRVARLALRMAELRRLKVQTRDGRPALAWPVQPVVVSSLFGTRFHPILKERRPHLGIDLAAADGQVVHATAPGTVISAGWAGAHGNRVEVQHAGNLISSYSHLSEVYVERGARVKQGETLGFAGSTGQSTGVHVHFELWRDGKPCDPLEELHTPERRVTPLATATAGTGR